MKVWLLRTAGALCIVIPLAASAAPGDSLYALGNNVNVRSAPSMSAEVIIQVNLGHKLIEFRRQGEWVEVGVARTGGKSGWVHSNLVGAVSPGGATVAPPDPKFDRFRASIEHLNAIARAELGADFFTRVENLGDAIVRITATDLWWSAPRSDRNSNLNTVFNLWDAADGTGLPIMVRITDERGEKLMTKARR